MQPARSNYLFVVIIITSLHHRSSFYHQSSLQRSESLKEVHIRKLLHLIHVSLGFDDFLIVKQHPGLLAVISGDGLADECYIVPVLSLEPGLL